MRQKYATRSQITQIKGKNKRKFHLLDAKFKLFVSYVQFQALTKSKSRFPPHNFSLIHPNDSKNRQNPFDSVLFPYEKPCISHMSCDDGLELFPQVNNGPVDAQSLGRPLSSVPLCTVRACAGDELRQPNDRSGPRQLDLQRKRPV